MERRGWKEEFGDGQVSAGGRKTGGSWDLREKEERWEKKTKQGFGTWSVSNMWQRLWEEQSPAVCYITNKQTLSSILCESSLIRQLFCQHLSSPNMRMRAAKGCYGYSSGVTLNVCGYGDALSILSLSKRFQGSSHENYCTIMINLVI